METSGGEKIAPLGGSGATHGEVPANRDHSARRFPRRRRDPQDTLRLARRDLRLISYPAKLQSRDPHVGDVDIENCGTAARFPLLLSRRRGELSSRHCWRVERTMNEDLTKLVQKKQQQSHSGASQIDWDDRRRKYVSAVEDLYRQIREALAESIAQEMVTAQTRSKQLTENYLGTYTVDDLILLIGNEQVLFSPTGRNIVGAIG